MKGSMHTLSASFRLVVIILPLCLYVGLSGHWAQRALRAVRAPTWILGCSVLRCCVRMGMMSLYYLQKGWWPYEAGAILNNKKCTKILTLFRFQLAMESIEPTLK
jgi:hypothetical protein